MICLVGELPGPSVKAQLEARMLTLQMAIAELAAILADPGSLNSGETWLIYKSLLILHSQAGAALELTRRLP